MIGIALTYILAFLDLIGVIVLVWGSVSAFSHFIVTECFCDPAKETKYIEKMRAHLGQKLLLGMEFFIAGDVIRVVQHPTEDQLLLLGGIVIIRVVLSYFLNLEIKDIKEKWGHKVWHQHPKRK